MLGISQDKGYEDNPRKLVKSAISLGILELDLI